MRRLIRLLLPACLAAALCATLAAQQPPGVFMSPTSGSGTTATFSFTASSATASPIAGIVVMFNYALDGGGACYFNYQPSANWLYLANDDGWNYNSGAALGAGTMQNSQCQIDLAHASGGSGASVTLTVPIAFKPAFPGLQNVYMMAWDQSGASSPWLTAGQWTTGSVINQAPTMSVSPVSGTGLAQTFTYTASSVNGSAYIMQVQGLFSSDGTANNACYVYYNHAEKYIFLLNDNQTAWSYAPLGTQTLLQNSQCTLDAGHSTAVGSGNTLTVNAVVTFNPSWSGTKTHYMNVVDRGHYLGLTQLGTWTVGTSSQPPVNFSVSPSSGAGISQTFKFTSRSLNGYNTISGMMVMFNYNVDGGGACYFNYQPGAPGWLYLSNDDGWSYQPGAALGAGTVANSQCQINLAASSVATGGDTVALTVAITFKSALPGSQNIYMYTWDQAGAVAPWQPMGTWDTGFSVIDQAPTRSLSPVSGIGLAQTFTYTATSVNGSAYIMQVLGLFSSDGTANNACYVYYNHAEKYIFLLNDNQTAWSYAPVGTSGTIQNSQCTLNTGQSTAVGSGNTLTLNAVVTFNPSWAGAKTHYMNVVDRGHYLGLTQLGTWTVGPLQTVTSVPPGLAFNVDGAACITPCGFQWAAGTSHTVAAPATIAGTTGVQSVFVSWSQGGAASQTITAPATSANYTATYQTQYYLTTGAGIGGSISPLSSWQNAGSTVQISANAGAGYTFTAFSGALNGSPNPQSLTVNAPASVLANFAQVFTQNITTSPAGLVLSIDGVACANSCTRTWPAGSIHSLSTVATQAGASGVQYVFAIWSDGGLLQHTISAPTAASTYTANFTTQYYLTTTAGAGGTIVPPSGWYNSGATVAIGATAATDYLFSSFSGAMNTITNPQSLNITAPATVTASFQPDFTLSTSTGTASAGAGGTSTSYTVTVSASSSFNSIVNFDAPGLPQGLTATFSPQSVTGAGQTTMTVLAPSGYGGYYTVYARGTVTGGFPQHTTSINLAVKDFVPTPMVTTATINSTGSTMLQWGITLLGGFTGTVYVSSVTINSNNAFACPNLYPVSVPGSDNTAVYLSSTTCQQGTYTLSVILAADTGAGHLFRTVNATLNATTVPTFSVTATQLTQSVTAGSPASWQINVQTTSNFSGSVAFNTSGFPSCTTVIAPPAPVSGNGSTTMQLGTSGCSAATYAAFPVSGTSGATTSTVNLTLVIQGGPAPATIISPATSTDLTGDTVQFTVNPGSQVAQYQLDLTAADGTVCSPRFTSPGSGGSTTASMNLSPCCHRRTPLTATMASTFTSNATQTQTYNFTCGLPPSSTIAGYVMLAGSGIRGVTIALSGGASLSTTTDDNGYYSFIARDGGNYTVTPSHTDYTFNPPSITYVNLSSDQTTTNFVGTRVPISQFRECIGPTGTGTVCTLPPQLGPYVIAAAPLRIGRSNLTVQGLLGQNTVLQRGNPGSGPAPNPIMTVAPGVTDVIIQYLQIDGNRAIIASRPMGQPDIDGYTPPPEIQPTGCPGGNLGSADLELSANSATVTIRSIDFRNAPDIAVSIGGANSEITNSTFGSGGPRFATRSTAIFVTGSGNRVINNTIMYAGTAAISIADGTNHFIWGNTITQNRYEQPIGGGGPGGQLYIAQEATGTRVDYNIIDGNNWSYSVPYLPYGAAGSGSDGYGCAVSTKHGPPYVSMEGMEIYGNGHMLYNNEVVNNYGSGIVLFGTSSVTISGNNDPSPPTDPRDPGISTSPGPPRNVENNGTSGIGSYPHLYNGKCNTDLTLDGVRVINNSQKASTYQIDLAGVQKTVTGFSGFTNGACVLPLQGGAPNIRITDDLGVVPVDCPTTVITVPQLFMCSATQWVKPW